MRINENVIAFLQVAKDELRPLRLVMAVDASKIPIAREELDTVVGNAMAGDE